MSGVVTGSKAGITAVVMVAAVMAMIDITIVNVALSDIRASFGTPLDQIGWVSTGYMMANIVIIPMTGWFQRRFGYKRYFAASIVLFTIASALCGTAWNLPSLVAFRVLQGLGGGAIIPTAQSLLFARYPKNEHGMAAGLFGLGAITGPLLGPTIGGYLIDISSWHSIFLVNVPIGIIAAFLAMRFIEEPGFVADDRPIDKVGIGLLAVGMASLQYSLEEGNREGWLDSPLIVGLGITAIVCITTFIVHELETKDPVVDLRVFANRSYAAGTGLNVLTGLALFGGSYLFSLFSGAVVHYDALHIGRVFLVASMVQIVLMPLVGRFSQKVDPRHMLFVGVCVVGLSQYYYSELTASAGFWDLVFPNFIRAIGLAFIFIPVSVASLSEISPEKRGNATGLFNLTRELGGSLGTATMGVIVTNGIKRHGSYLAENVTIYNPLAVEQMNSIRAGVGNQTFTNALVPEAIMQMKVTVQAMVLSFADGFHLAMVVILFGVVLVALMRKPKAGVDVAGAH